MRFRVNIHVGLLYDINEEIEAANQADALTLAQQMINQRGAQFVHECQAGMATRVNEDCYLVGITKVAVSD